MYKFIRLYTFIFSNENKKNQQIILKHFPKKKKSK